MAKLELPRASFTLPPSGAYTWIMKVKGGRISVSSEKPGKPHTERCATEAYQDE